MRLLCCLLFVFTAGVVVAADDFKLEAGYKLIFTGKNLDGWQTKSESKKDKDGNVKVTKGESLEGKTEAFGGRFKVKDGELIIDPSVKGDKYIETAKELSGDFTIRFDFKPDDKCNNDLLFMGTKFDIKSDKSTKGVKVGEWNTMEITMKGGSVDYKINGEAAGTQKTKAEKGAFNLRAEFGGMSIKNLRMTDGK